MFHVLRYNKNALRNVTACFALLLGATTTTQAAPNRSLMTDANATMIGEARILPRWAKIMSSQAALKQGVVQCPIGPAEMCRTKEWRRFERRARAMKGPALLDFVNEFVNRVPYRSDEYNYNRADYWAPPQEFFKNGGDCEEYVFAKYFILKHLGVPVEKMRMVVVVDSGLGHAILVVAADGQDVPLDNRFSIIESIETRHRYKVVYSFDEQQAWVHTKTVYRRPTKPINRNLYTWFRSGNVFDEGLPSPAASNSTQRKSSAETAKKPATKAPAAEQVIKAIQVGETPQRKPATKPRPLDPDTARYQDGTATGPVQYGYGTTKAPRTKRKAAPPRRVSATYVMPQMISTIAGDTTTTRRRRRRDVAVVPAETATKSPETATVPVPAPLKREPVTPPVPKLEIDDSQI